MQQLINISGLENYYLFPTSIGEVYYEMNDKREGKKCYEKALQLNIIETRTTIDQ
ncbi:MAG TPA: tetratricopeptide repeat protein [Flavisolibacter sp.]|nr:tetratricopeptide repeat protein [Flavisolibacter sp.]